MGLDVGGNTIASSGSGIAINTNFTFNGSGYGAIAGLSGVNGSLAGGSSYSSTGSGWVAANLGWSSGYNSSTGVFTAPVAGYYAAGFNGILNGGSGIPGGHNTYGYFAFVQNGALNYWGHNNLAPTNPWNNGGCSAVFNCAAGDTIALRINQSPTPTSEAYYGSAYNYGAYPDNHHCMWIVQVG